MEWGCVWSLWRLSWKLPKSRLLWIWVNTHPERLEAELQKLEELLKAESLERRASRGTVTLKWVPGEEAAPTPWSVPEESQSGCWGLVRGKRPKR